MINNFNQIKSLLKFENEHEFYFVQILQRKKEHPELGKNNRLIKAYYIYSIEKLDKYTEEIIGLCEKFNARAYIHLNRRNSKQIAFEMMELLATNLKCDQVNFLDKLYNSVCGTNKGVERSWIVDYDSKETLRLNMLAESINRTEPKGDKIITTIPTKNGYHIITKPFNKKEFSNKNPEIEIHTNNPTILYCL